LQVLPVQRLPSLQLPWLLVLVEEVWFFRHAAVLQQGISKSYWENLPIPS
jgi:hypothetical protein